MLTTRISKEALLRLRRAVVRRQLGIEARCLFRPLRKLRAIARTSSHLSVCIGPNTAGQAHAWAQALRAHCPGAVLNKHTHVLIESGRSLFGPSRGFFGGDLPLLEAAGLQIALVSGQTTLPSRNGVSGSG